MTKFPSDRRCLNLICMSGEAGIAAHEYSTQSRCYIIALGSDWLTHTSHHFFQTLHHTMWLPPPYWSGITITSDSEELSIFNGFLCSAGPKSTFPSISNTIPFNSSQTNSWHNIFREKGDPGSYPVVECFKHKTFWHGRIKNMFAFW